MNSNSFFLKSFRVVLLPFAILYGIIIFIRNKLYDHNILKTTTFNFPVICIGNLAVGGTGKSPMVEYLLDILKNEFKVATLSRGYKRKTKGYVLANQDTTALEIGDEPMQFHQKFKDIPVAVCEERTIGITHLLQDISGLQTIILDDAFQHREVNAGFNILLTDYSNRFTKDFFLPTGDLRDQRSSYKRAQIIVITKCPPDLSEEEKRKITYEIHAWQGQQVFFTCIEYGLPYHIFDINTTWQFSGKEEVLLVCGIANTKPLKDYLHANTYTYYQVNYNDHHIFNIDDLNHIKEKFNNITAQHKIVVTTEKDAVRLTKFTTELSELPLFVLPIKHKFLFNEADQFSSLIHTYINSYNHQTTNDKN